MWSDLLPAPEHSLGSHRTGEMWRQPAGHELHSKNRTTIRLLTRETQPQRPFTYGCENSFRTCAIYGRCRSHIGEWARHARVPDNVSRRGGRRFAGTGKVVDFAGIADALSSRRLSRGTRSDTAHRQLRYSRPLGRGWDG